MGLSINSATIPVAQAGGACPLPGNGNTDPNPTQSEVNAWAAAGTYTVGGLSLLSSTGFSVRDVNGNTVTNMTKFNGFTGSFNRLSAAGVASSLTTPPV